jgi:hypothetical protein
MRRVVFLMILALVSCLGAPAVFSQGWTPGPPISAMPQPGGPLPMMGQPGAMPGMDPSCLPMPTCMPQMCEPPKNGSIAGMVGYQINTDPGKIKFATRGHHLIQLTTQELDFVLNGVWVGGSARMEMSESVSLRGEYRHLFPTREQVHTRTTINVGAPGNRDFDTSRYNWNIVDGNAALCIGKGISLLAGCRWDLFEISMGNTGTIPLLSSPVDEGNLTLSSIQPYAGAEFAWMMCDSGLMFRIIGAPWTTTYHNLGLTFGNGGVPDRGPIRDSLVGDSRFGSLVEASIYYGMKVSCSVTVGGFAMLNMMTSHCEQNMDAYRYAGTGPVALPAVSVSVPFDVDLNRLSFSAGGNVAVGFTSPL